MAAAFIHARPRAQVVARSSSCGTRRIRRSAGSTTRPGDVNVRAGAERATGGRAGLRPAGRRAWGSRSALSAADRENDPVEAGAGSERAVPSRRRRPCSGELRRDEGSTESEVRPREARRGRTRRSGRRSCGGSRRRSSRTASGSTSRLSWRPGWAMWWLLPACAPPASWFEDPQLDGPTPLTITAEGHIFGHVADWNTCPHAVSRAARACACCRRSKHTGYALFHLGSVLTDDGKDISVGTLTLDAPHAGIQLNAHGASRHYDHTGTAVADVRAGEDRHGPWVARRRSARTCRIRSCGRCGRRRSAATGGAGNGGGAAGRTCRGCRSHGRRRGVGGVGVRRAADGAGGGGDRAGLRLRQDLSDAVSERRVKVLAAGSGGH